MITRDITLREFRRHETLWLQGPPNLQSLLASENCSKFSACTVLCSEKPADTAVSCVSSSNKQSCPINIDSFVDVKKFGSFHKLVRVTAYVLKFVKILREKSKDRSKSNSVKLSVHELVCAENFLIALDQNKYFAEIFEYFVVNNGKSCAGVKKPAIIDQLSLKIDNNLIRSHGRLENSCMSYSCKFPILLSPNSKLTELIIHDAHKTTLHSGTNYLLNFIREKFWIPRGRQIIKKYVKKCVTCKKVTGKPFACPPHAPLPSGRVCESRPFQVVGVDLTGSIMVKDKSNIIKAYIVLFTCAVTRAIHLEVVYSLSSDDFLRALIKFASRRSLPQIIYSDNATNFIGTADTLNQIYRSQVVYNYLLDNKVSWKFITPRASWHGGFWERLMGLTKNVLKKVVGKALLSWEDFKVIVPQVECVLNDCPLTYSSDVVDDFPSITPSQLVHGFKLREFPNILNEEIISDPSYGSKDVLSKMFIYRTRVLNRLLNRWKHEYLTSLRERYNSKSFNSKVKVGQIVLIYDNLTPRVSWKLGAVSKLFHGIDGHVRSVEVQTQSGFLLRPITKLYPLEVECIEEAFAPAIPESSYTRPLTRRAAIEARERFGKASP